MSRFNSLFSAGLGQKGRLAAWVVAFVGAVSLLYVERSKVDGGAGAIILPS